MEIEPQKKRKLNKILFGVIGAVVLFVIIGSIAGANSGSKKTETVAQEPATSEVQKTTEAKPTPIKPVKKAPEEFHMPDFTDWNLQDAQDGLQAIGNYNLKQADAYGLGRVMVLDSNWHVCSQSPAADEVTNVEAPITLYSAKNDELCP